MYRISVLAVAFVIIDGVVFVAIVAVVIVVVDTVVVIAFVLLVFDLMLGREIWRPNCTVSLFVPRDYSEKLSCYRRFHSSMGVVKGQGGGE